jgi:hypothetical protein
MMQNSIYAINQSSSDPIFMEKLTDKFVRSFVLNGNTPTDVVEIETISSSVCIEELWWSIKFLFLYRVAWPITVTYSEALSRYSHGFYHF